MISPRTFLRSLRHALRGLTDTFRTEQNFRMQLIIAGVVICASFLFRVEIWEGIVVILLSAGVLVLEIMNTIVERLADAVQPRLSHMVREVKDMMAGTVLLASLASISVGVLIFYPHFALFIEDLLAWLQTVLY